MHSKQNYKYGVRSGPASKEYKTRLQICILILKKRGGGISHLNTLSKVNQKLFKKTKTKNTTFDTEILQSSMELGKKWMQCNFYHFALATAGLFNYMKNTVWKQKKKVFWIFQVSKNKFTQLTHQHSPVGSVRQRNDCHKVWWEHHSSENSSSQTF